MQAQIMNARAWRKPFALSAALALGLSCAQADVDGNGANGGGANSGKGANSGIGGFAEDIVGKPADGDSCNKTEIKPERLIPTVALVIDRSSSMTERYGGGTRWDVLKAALLDPTTGLIKAKESEVRFGLAMYTSTPQAAVCPMLDNVDFAVEGYAAINALYGPALTPNVKAETPTADAIRAVTAKLLAVQERGPKYILLATDGEPDTCPGTCMGDCPTHERPNFPRDPNCGQDESIAAVEAAHAQGIKTFVVAIGNEVGEPHLKALANAGQGYQPVLTEMVYSWLRYTCNIKPRQFKGKYIDVGLVPNETEPKIVPPTQTPMQAEAYRPEDGEALARDLTKIINNVADCKFKLNGSVNVMSAALGTVALSRRADGQATPLRYQDAAGWRMNTDIEIELLGQACEQFQTGEFNLTADFPCGVFNPE